MSGKRRGSGRGTAGALVTGVFMLIAIAAGGVKRVIKRRADPE